LKWFQQAGGIAESHAAWIWIATVVAASLLAFDSVPDVRGAIPAGGMLGTLLASALMADSTSRSLYRFLGVLVTATFLTTSFSFASTHAWATSSKGPIGAAARRESCSERRQVARWQAGREQETDAPPGGNRIDWNRRRLARRH